jgi:transcriptional regulator with XRE-family HTH domain
MTQEDFAEALGISQPVVSAWEAYEDGDEKAGHKPSEETYLRIAALALQKNQPDAASYFLELSGDFGRSVLPLAAALYRERHAPERAGEIIRVPALPQVEPDLTKSIPFPASVILRPDDTFYVRISDTFMSPVWEPGDFLAIDRSETDLRNLAPCKVALYRHGDYFEVEGPDRKKQRQQARDSMTEESRNRAESVGEWPYEHLGLHVGYLRKTYAEIGPVGFVLEWYPGGVSRDLLVGRETGRTLYGLRVLGRVVACIGDYTKKR